MARRTSLASNAAVVTASALLLAVAPLAGCSSAPSVTTGRGDVPDARSHVRLGVLNGPTLPGGPVQLGAGDPLGRAVHAWYMALHASEREAWAAASGD